MSEKQREKALKQLFSAPFEGQDDKVVSDETDSSDAEITEKASNENPLSNFCSSLCS